MAKTKPTAMQKKGKRKAASRPAVVAMKAAKAEKEARSNPFEAIWSRRKFDILGKKRKGEERRLAHARSLAIDKRKNTLLKEYEQSTKSSVFIDKRIGEQDDTLEEYEKAVLRQQRERMSKLTRTNKYNLSDGEDDDAVVHQVHSLSGKDDFDEDVPLDDGSDDECNLAEKRLALQSIPLPSETELPEDGTGHKSKKDVMTEIISKSKFYKAQKAKEKEEDEHLIEKLDNDFASLAQTKALLSLTESSKLNASRSAYMNDSSGTIHRGGSFGSTGKEIFNKEKPDAYDKLVKEMVLDSRARPSDRTKTPEEIAQEERERLEKLEEERQKRMVGAADSSDEDNDHSEDDPDTILDSTKHISGDDLGDSFSLNEPTRKKKGWVDEIYENEGKQVGEEATTSDDGENDDEHGEDDEGASDADDSSDHDFGNMSARDWEQSDEDDVGLEEDEMEDVNEKDQDINGKMVKQERRSSERDSVAKPLEVKDDNLPFVIEAPKDLKDLCNLLDGRSESEIIEVINRIRACNSIRLAAENRKKMQVFYGVLLQYFAVLATQRPLKFKIIDALVKPLIEMSAETPYFAAICARQRLIHMRTRLCEDIKIPGKSSWPSLKTLLLLRLWSLIFPSSDFRHAVTTPMLLLMCEYLMRCPIQSGQDIAVGSFLCSMVLVITKESKKFCPEAIVFLQTLLVSSLKGKHLHYQVTDQFMELKTMKPWLCILDQAHEVNAINILEIMGMESDSPYFSSDRFKASILFSVAETLRGFVIIHEELRSFPEIFLPMASLLQEVMEKSDLPGLLQDILQEVIDLINKKTDEHHALREPLQMRKQKPQPIKLLNPNFVDNYIKGLDYDPDRERAQMKKLKKRLKSEKKGAIRELRKDNYFLSTVKEKTKREQELERAEKYGKAMAFLQAQEHAFKSGQLGKGRKRRR